MAPKLEVVKESGGSIRVGTTGTIGCLMSKELDMKCAPQSRRRPKQELSPISVSAPYDALKSPKKLQPRRNVNEASSSSGSNLHSNDRLSDSTQKGRRNPQKGAHHMPILNSDNASIENTPSREKTEKRVNLVGVVDIKCGYPNKWPSPIPNRFKKLNSSKLSETIA